MAALSDTTRNSTSAAPSEPLLTSSLVHVVRVKEDGRFSSDTLSSRDLNALDSICRANRILGETNPRRLAALREWCVERQRCGLLVYDELLFPDRPQPAVQAFEAVELGSKDALLQTLAAPQFARDRRFRSLRLFVEVLVSAVVGAFIVASVVTAVRQNSIPPTPLLAWTGILLGAAAVWSVLRKRERWWIVPGGVVIKSRSGELILLTPAARIALLRKDESMRLVRILGDSAEYVRSVTAAEHFAFASAWTSRLAPPPIHIIQEWLR